MRWGEELTEGIILKRYKRFLADVALNGKELTAHVPNTGSMQSCWDKDWKCALSFSSNPNRKMPYTLELTWNGETWIGVNTANANKIVHEALTNQQIIELSGYSQIQPEKKINDKSRIDFFLSGTPDGPDCYVEVKSVTLKKDGFAQFPDAVSTRGQKHLEELMDLKKQGFRAVMLYIVQREDVDVFYPAKEIDPEYSRLLKKAYEQGVEILVYQCKINPQEITLGPKLDFELR